MPGTENRVLLQVERRHVPLQLREVWRLQVAAAAVPLRHGHWRRSVCSVQLSYSATLQADDLYVTGRCIAVLELPGGSSFVANVDRRSVMAHSEFRHGQTVQPPMPLSMQKFTMGDPKPGLAFSTDSVVKVVHLFVRR